MNLFLNFKSEKETEDFFCSELNRLLECVYSNDEIKICLAVSGGSDSNSLLFLSKIFENKSKRKIKIYCVTVNHDLREEALEEALFVKHLCEQLNISHEILKWEHKNFDFDQHGKLENAAREARYKLISDFCEKKEIKAILTGHTWNDQLETFEMRKKTGSSKSGLACMSQIKSLSENLKIIRPLLRFSKNHLRDFLKTKNAEWKNDPMNEMDEFMRVSIRKKIKNYDEEKIENISKEILNFGRQRNEIETRAVDVLKKCIFFPYGYAAIDLNLMTAEQIEIQCEILKRIIWNIGRKKYAMNITSDILQNISEKKINTLGRCLFKIKKNRMFIFRENRNIRPVKIETMIPNENYIFDNRFSISVNKKSNDINIKCTENEDLPVLKKILKKNNIEIPHEVISTLPCLYQGNKMIFVHGVENISLDSTKRENIRFRSCFIKKAELFDIFY